MAIDEQVGSRAEDGTLIVDTVAGGALRHKITAYTGAAGSTAIAVKAGIVHLTKASAGAYTLADPTSGDGYDGDNGKVLHIRSTTAFAHTITASGGYDGGANTVATLGGAVGDGISLYASGGKWRILQKVNATMS